jgi:hypothetical protein
MNAQEAVMLVFNNNNNIYLLQLGCGSGYYACT